MFKNCVAENRQNKAIFPFQEKKRGNLDNCSVHKRAICLLITVACEAMSRLHKQGENHSPCALTIQIWDLVKLSILQTHVNVSFRWKSRGREEEIVHTKAVAVACNLIRVLLWNEIIK